MENYKFKYKKYLKVFSQNIKSALRLLFCANLVLIKKISECDKQYVLALFTSAFFVLFFCFFDPLWQTNDDVGMSMRAHGYGAVSNATSNLLFSNVIWGYFVRLIPAISGIVGYSIATLLVLVIVGSVIFYGMIRFGVDYCCGLLVLLLLLPRPILSPQFTVNAGLLTVASVVMLMLYIRFKGLFLLFAGCLLFYLGFLVRWKQAVLVLIVALPFLLRSKLLERRSAKITLICTLLIIGFSFFANYAAYQDPMWQPYYAFQKARIFLIDFGGRKHLETRPDILNRVKFSLNDLHLLSSWFFEDPKIACPDKLNAMHAELGSTFTQEGAIRKGLIAVRDIFHPWLIPILLSALFFSFLSRNPRLFLSWALCVLFIFITGLMGRPSVLRVYIPLVSLLFVESIMLAKRQISRKTCMIVLMLASIVNLFFLLPDHFFKRSLWKENIEALSQFTKAPEELLVTWGASFPFETVYSVLTPFPESFPYPLYSLSASTLAPTMVSYSSKAQGEGMLERLKAKKEILLVANENQLALLQTYFREHYQVDLEVTASESFGKIRIKRVRMLTAGELVADVRLRQSVNTDMVQSLDGERSALPLCVEVLFGNSDRRENRGTIRLGIDLDGRIESREIDVRTVKDNEYHRICFENVTLRDVHEAREVHVLLEGVDSEPGSAVTAWTTRDLGYGALVTTDGSLKERSLVFRLVHLDYVPVFRNDVEDSLPAGELIADVRLRQSVNADMVQSLDEERSALPLCVEVLLANYGNRENRGTIRLGIDLDGRIESREIDVRTVKDNAYHRICFENVTLRDVHEAREVHVLLEGVDSEPGSAVTAWTTRDLGYGALVTTDDRLKERSLVFRIDCMQSSALRDILQILLIVITLFLVIVAVLRQD